jgi:DNA invertase Pin-like site-specific DNA recombinase
MARTKAGRERALAAGIKFGPKFKLTPHQRREAIKRLEAGESQSEIAKSYNVSQSMISRLK